MLLYYIVKMKQKKINMDATYITWGVGKITAYLTVLRLTGLRGWSVTLGLQKAQL